MGSPPGQGTEVLYATWRCQKKKQTFSALEMTIYICDSQLGVILVDSVWSVMTKVGGLLAFNK